MKVAYVSTYPPAHCGIGTYTQSLRQALPSSIESIILAEIIPGGPLKKEPGVIRCWARGCKLDNIIREINKLSGVTTVHIQHEHGLFPSSKQLFEFTKALLDKDLFITLHTIDEIPKHSGFFASATGFKGKFIVHSYAAAAWAVTCGIYEPVVIPHGVRVLAKTRESIDDARSKLKIKKEEFLIACPGFISYSKNHREILEGLSRFLHSCKGTGPPVRLIISGECKDSSYLIKLEQEIINNGLEDFVTVIYKFSEDPRELLLAADLVILGAKETSPFSASGQLHDALGAGVPILAKSVPIYQSDNAGVLLYRDSVELAAFIEALHYDFKLLRTMSMAAKRSGETKAWTNIAIQHVELYTKGYRPKP